MSAAHRGPGQDADRVALEGAKRQLRAAVLVRRSARPEAERVTDDEARFAVLADMLGARLPDTVAAYLSADDEPDTLRLVSWLTAQGMRVLLPVLTDGIGRRLDEPAWAPYAGPDALRVGRAGLLEPTGTRLLMNLL